jgi:uncharacterized OB-fold protein
MASDSDEKLILPFTYDVPYRWSAGEYVGGFLRELRDNCKIYCNVCPDCGRALAPPRPVCGRCHVRMGRWEELGPQGTVLLCNVNQYSFWDPTEGGMRAVPYATAIIQLDGPPALFQHFLEETDPDRLSVGMRVEAVFKPKEERTGHILDILHFRGVDT